MKLWKIIALVLLGVVSAVVVLNAIDIVDAGFRSPVAEQQAL